MFEWFKRRGQRPKRLAEMSPEELDAIFAGHPELEHLLRHSLGIMQFAPPRVAEQVLVQIEAIVDDTLQRNLSPDEEHHFVMGKLEEVRQMISTAVKEQ